MAVNKVVYNAKVLIELTNDTVNAENLTEGYTAHNAKGNLITGTRPPASFETWVLEMEDGTTVEMKVNVGG
jgi:hypothetical protein